MTTLKMHSPNLVDSNIAHLAKLFPNCVTEKPKTDDNGNVLRDKDGQVVLELGVDFELLKQELSHSVIDGSQERYRLDWVGKREAIMTANSPIAKTLRPVRVESVDFDTTENLFIEGDNLEALKLLQESYLSKVKMIYIDPPYNTGNDFIYNDDFAQDTAEFFERSGQVDADGNRLVANTESNGRFHSDWLSMMYSRLKLARNLLADDGVLFVSINNAEIANLKKICNEVFGERNFIEIISWNKRVPKNDKGIGNIHDFVLIYAKDESLKHEFLMLKEGLEEIDLLLKNLKKKQIPISEAEEEVKKLYKKNAYDRGITLYNSLDSEYELWGKINMSWPNSDTFGPRYEVLHPITKKPVKVPDRGWRWKKTTFDDVAGIANNNYQNIEKLHDGSYLCKGIWFAKDENTQPSSVTYLKDVNYFLLRSIISLKSDGGIELEKIFEGKSYFSNPKPTTLMRFLLGSIHEKNALILDFFAGSSTTAHAVMQLNAEDGGNRKFIMVQIPETTDPKSEAYKAGYPTIAEISKERIRRAGTKIRQDNADKDLTQLDTGFRVLKIDTTNMADIYYRPEDYSQDLLGSLENNIKPDRTDEDLLFQFMLDTGIPLSLPIERSNVGGHTIYQVGGNSLIASLDHIDANMISEIAKMNPLKFITSERAIATDSDKTNIVERFKQLSPHTDVRFI